MFSEDGPNDFSKAIAWDHRQELGRKLTEAAARIEELEAENKRLLEVRRSDADAVEYAKEIRQLRLEGLKLMRQERRLREALKNIADGRWNIATGKSLTFRQYARAELEDE